MFGERDFQLVLPSNASAALFKDNAANNYKTRLAVPLNLEGEWEVALLDMQFSRNWPNVFRDTEVGFIFQPKTPQLEIDADAVIKQYTSSDFNKFLPKVRNVLVDEKKPVAFSGGLCHFSVAVKKDYYEDETTAKLVKSIADVVNSSTETIMAAAKFRLAFQYDSEISRTFINADGPMVVVCEDPHLMEDVLGFDRAREVKVEGKTVYVYSATKGKRRPISGDHRSIFVYSDFVKFVRVGDTQAPLLGAVSVPKGSYGDQVHWAAPIAHYTAVSKAYMDTLQIQLNTDEGDLFPFDARVKVICRLHFRRRSPI